MKQEFHPKNQLVPVQHTLSSVQSFTLHSQNTPQTTKHLPIINRLDGQKHREDEKGDDDQNESIKWSQELRKSNETQADSLLSVSSKYNLREKLREIKVKKLEGDIRLKFQNKRSEKEENQLLRGIIGSKYIINFMQYVMEFKLHLKDEYRNQKIQKKTPKVTFTYQSNPTSLNKFEQSNVANAEKTPITTLTFQELKDKCERKSIVHQGFKCDECEEQPIVGPRYHCNEFQCDDDFDLCEECFLRKGHKHKMGIIKNNMILKQLQTIEKMMKEYKRRAKSMLIEHEEVGRKNFGSSIN